MSWLALIMLAAPVASAPGIVVSHGGNVYVEGRRVAQGTSPAWSPDGTRIAFQRGGALFVARPTGENVRRLAVPGPALGPAWRPDGRRIAFSNGRDIYSVDVASGKVTRLTRTTKPWLANHTPAYSPNGKRIAFSRSTDAFNSDIFVMDANGRNLRRLTTSRGTDSVLGEEHAPAWSPDGRTIVFVTNRSQRSLELWRVGADGRNERAITRTPSRNEDTPRFSRDGGRILFTHDGRVAEMKLDGSGVRELGSGDSADWRG
jgi:Tol biopolymer transport system component